MFSTREEGLWAASAYQRHGALQRPPCPALRSDCDAENLQYQTLVRPTGTSCGLNLGEVKEHSPAIILDCFSDLTISKEPIDFKQQTCLEQWLAHTKYYVGYEINWGEQSVPRYKVEGTTGWFSGRRMSAIHENSLQGRKHHTWCSGKLAFGR